MFCDRFVHLVANHFQKVETRSTADVLNQNSEEENTAQLSMCNAEKSKNPFTIQSSVVEGTQVCRIFYDFNQMRISLLRRVYLFLPGSNPHHLGNTFWCQSGSALLVSS